MGQGVKSWIKDKVQEPRPFVIWLEKTHHIPVDEFYTLKRAERGNLVKEQLAEEKYPTIFAFTLAERDGVCPSFRSHDVCCQLGTAGRWFAVAANRGNVNHCYLAGRQATGVMGKPPAARDALATRSGSSYVDFVGAGGGGNVALVQRIF